MVQKVSRNSQPRDTNFLTEYNDTDERWDFNKSANNMVSRYYREAGHVKYSQRTEDCARRLGMALRSDCDGNQVLRLQSVYLCHVRLCPVCQAARTQVWRNRVNRCVPVLLEREPKTRYVFLTLTVKNCPVDELRETLLRMSKAFNNLMKRSAISKHVTGYIKSTEVTKSEIYEAHPHFHVLLAVTPSYFSRGYIQQHDWVDMWAQSLKVHYDPIVDIRSIKDFEPNKTREEILLKNVRELAKYLVKPMDMIGTGRGRDRDFFIELSNQLHGIKATNTSGLFKQYIKICEPSEEEILEANLEDIEKYSHGEINLSFEWLKGHKKYGYHNKS